MTARGCFVCMAEHSEPTPFYDPEKPRPEIPPPPVPHRHWVLRGKHLSLSYEKAPPSSRTKHSHPEIKLAVTFELASGIFTSWKNSGESHEVRLNGRQVYCVGAHVPHAVHWEKEAPLLEALLRPSSLDGIPPEQVVAALARESLEGAAYDPVLWELASKIRLLCSRHEQPDIRLLEPMMAAFARRIFTCHCECYAPKPGSRLSEDRTQAVMDYMEENIGKKIDVEELAALVRLSPPHFTVLFRNRTGKPPIERLRELRRIRAHDMIFGGEFRMGEIAIALGFCDEPHLNREFKNFFGYTARLLRTRGQSA